jgi:hypothetical protein
MRLLFVLCLLVCVLFALGERTTQRKRSASSGALQVSASRVASRSRNGALIQRIKSSSGVRRAVTRSRSAVAAKRRSVRSRSRSAVSGRRNARRRFAKQEEADLDQNANQGFGEETASSDSGSETPSSADTSNGSTPVESPTVESESPTSTGTSGDSAPSASNGTPVDSPVQTPPAATSNGNNAISAGGFGGFPGNFKFPSFPGNGAVGGGFAQAQGPGIAFGAGFATSNGRQSSSGGFGAAFSAPSFGLNQPSAAPASTEAPAPEEELAQLRRRPR